MIEFFFDHRTFMDLSHSIDNGLIFAIDLAMETSNPSLEGKYALTSQVGGAQNSTPT